VSVQTRPLCVHLLGDTHDAGAENQCRYLLAGLRDAGEMDVELAYFGEGRAHRSFAELGVPLLHVPRLRRFRFDAYGRARRLRRAYASRPPDLLHTWLPESNVVGLLAARHWPGTRVVISQRGSWNELDFSAFLRLQKLLLRDVDHAISNSAGGADLLTQLGMARDRISVIPNGIPSERVAVERDRDDIRRELGWNGDEIVVWVGRADRLAAAQKDLGTLFAAFEALRAERSGARLAMVGPTKSEIEDCGLELPDGGSALGWWARPADLLNAADGLIISSRVEGNSNVAGEALLLGLPVATTESGGHCEAVRQAGGCVVPVGDHVALAAAMAHLLADPPDRSTVRRRARDLLSVGRMVDAHLETYREVLSRA
jgi:glycosyltransferase involved in cell wall biosynthesis